MAGAAGTKATAFAGTDDAFYIVTTAASQERAQVFIRGDADLDGALGIADVFSVLEYLFLGTLALACLDAADADDSGLVDLGDSLKVLFFVFEGDRPPPAPFPEPGPDPGGAPGCRQGLDTL